ncbi:DUF6461 domain-containing protein [Geodermatophilus sp. FMUSA9-8]|uniref:DUF6461 domain-containing protein n=1 Tax=Geodermatophilus sp. FMUSA9-8 TaxID=3120155 RepID=UPI00300BB8AD
MSDYSFIERFEALTVTFVRGSDLDRCGEVLRFRWPTESQATLADAEMAQFDALADTGGAQAVLQVDELAGWLVFVEPGGWLTTDHALLGALSAGGQAVSVFWNVEADTQFAYARQGAVVRSFEAVLFEQSAVGEPLPQEAGLGFGQPRIPVRALMMELAERITGVTLDEEWLLDRSRRTWRATVYELTDANLPWYMRTPEQQ